MNISRRWILSLAGASAIFSFIAKFARAASVIQSAYAWAYWLPSNQRRMSSQS
jgi:hypothetical protein